MSVVFNLKDVHIIGKNNIVMIVKVVKFVLIIVENQYVKIVKVLGCVFIIYKRILVLNVI